MSATLSVAGFNADDGLAEPLMAAYSAYCSALLRGPDAVELRLRTATRFLAAHPDPAVWMTRPIDARLADLRRSGAWPLLCFAAVTGRLRMDADLLAEKNLGGLGRAVEEEHPADFASLREAAGRLGWSPRFTEQAVRQGVVAAVAFTGRPPRALTAADIDELDAAFEASPHIGAGERYHHHKRSRAVRRLIYEAGICDTPAPGGRVATSDCAKIEAAVAAPEIRRTMTAYVRTRAPQLRPGTITGIANDLASFGEFLAERHPDIDGLTGLTRTHVEEYLTYASDRPYRGHLSGSGRTVGPAASGHAVTTLRCFLDDIAAWGWSQAPARRVVFASDIPRTPKLLPRALPTDVDTALM
ncbi:MAG: hypothetical protein WCF12_03335, partial [Propionicimonas sp.]